MRLCCECLTSKVVFSPLVCVSVRICICVCVCACACLCVVCLLCVSAFCACVRVSVCVVCLHVCLCVMYVVFYVLYVAHCVFSVACSVLWVACRVLCVVCCVLRAVRLCASLSAFVFLSFFSSTIGVAHNSCIGLCSVMSARAGSPACEFLSHGSHRGRPHPCFLQAKERRIFQETENGSAASP